MTEDWNTAKDNGLHLQGIREALDKYADDRDARHSTG